MEYVSAAFGVVSGALVALALLAAAGLVVVAVAWRIAVWLRIDAASRVNTDLAADAVAYLRAGPRAAVLTSVAYLRAAGAIGRVEPPPSPAPLPEPPPGSGMRAQLAYVLKSAGRTLTGPSAPKGLVATGPYPGGTRLDSALYAEINTRPDRVFSDLAASASVVAAVEAIEAALKTDGYLGSRSGRWVRGWGRFIAFLIGLTGLAVGFFSMAGRSGDGGLAAIVLVGAAVGTFFLLGALIQDRRLSTRGEGAVKNMRRRVPASMKASAWPTIGATAAAYVVAVYGGAAVWAADPTFASAATIQTSTASSSGNGSSCGSGGSGCSGGSSCGGGGGGGCGGGGGGGCGG